jgi:hypothetical protein
MAQKVCRQSSNPRGIASGAATANLIFGISGDLRHPNKNNAFTMTIFSQVI